MFSNKHAYYGNGIIIFQARKDRIVNVRQKKDNDSREGVATDDIYKDLIKPQEKKASHWTYSLKNDVTPAIEVIMHNISTIKLPFEKNTENDAINKSKVLNDNMSIANAD